MSNLYLVGFMGAGKTVTGRVVATRLGRAFVDLDEAVEARFGLPVREIFRRHGEGAFREAETAELERTAAETALVVAIGGGAFSSPENRRLIRESGGVSVFLDPPWSTIQSRLGSADPSRPKWVDDEQARSLFEARRPGYRKASVHLELTGEETPDAIADRVLAALPETACAS